MRAKNVWQGHKLKFLMRIDQNKPKILNPMNKSLEYMQNPINHLIIFSSESFGMSKCIWEAKQDFLSQKNIFLISFESELHSEPENRKKSWKVECWWQKKLFMEFFLTRLQIIYHSGLKCSSSPFIWREI